MTVITSQKARCSILWQVWSVISVEGDAVHLATGWETALPEGIAALGLADHRPIAVGNDLRTELPHIYAPGDVNGRSMLFHSAVQQSRIAAHNIFGVQQRSTAETLPGVPFPHPMIAEGIDRAARISVRDWIALESSNHFMI